MTPATPPLPVRPAAPPSTGPARAASDAAPEGDDAFARLLAQQREAPRPGPRTSPERGPEPTPDAAPDAAPEAVPAAKTRPAGEGAEPAADRRSPPPPGGLRPAPRAATTAAEDTRRPAPGALAGATPEEPVVCGLPDDGRETPSGEAVDPAAATGPGAADALKLPVPMPPTGPADAAAGATGVDAAAGKAGAPARRGAVETATRHDAAGDDATPAAASNDTKAGVVAAAADTRAPATAGEASGTLPTPPAPPAPAAAPAAPELTAPAHRSAAAPAEAALAARPGSPAFGAQLGAQLSLWVRQGVQEARLVLNPAELGPVQVRIALDGSAAQVVMSAAQAETRQALDQALPMLAFQLREAGLTLAGGGVFEQAPRRDDAGGPPDGGGRRGGVGERAEAPAPLRSALRAPRGVVDLVA